MTIATTALSPATIVAFVHSNDSGDDYYRHREPTNDALLVLLPLLIVLSTFLFLLLLFLVCIILLRRRRGIALRDTDGPIDMSRDDLVQGEGGFDGVESRWLENVNDRTRRLYLRAKGTFLVRFGPQWNIDPCPRLSTAIPAQLAEHRHHFISVSVYPRERRLGVVF